MGVKAEATMNSLVGKPVEFVQRLRKFMVHNEFKLFSGLISGPQSPAKRTRIEVISRVNELSKRES